MCLESEEPILAVCPFGWAGSLCDSPGPLGGGIASLVSRRRAGGLPERFVLVLTPSRLLAYAGRELAAWDRARLRVHMTARDDVVEMVLTTGDRQIAIQAPRTPSTVAFIQSLMHRV